MIRDNCRLCHSKNLKVWLDLGFHPHSDQFRKTRDAGQMTYPLRVVQCQDCEFNQLDYVVPAQELYTIDYLYESSITATGDIHWDNFAESVIEKTGIKTGSVLDIGSNDGTLLSKFQKRGFNVVGVDPCGEIAKLAVARGIPTINAFFDRRVTKNLAKVDIITGSNVFAHIDDLDETIETVLSLLNEDGVFIFESPYFGEFLKGLEYDTVYHQHLSYISIKPVAKFLAKYGLEIFDIELSAIHGGSIRTYICRKGKRVVDLAAHLFIEDESFTFRELEIFAQRVNQHRTDLTKLLVDLKLDGKSIVGVSSPAKGMTLLNYTKVGHFLDYLTERSTLKVGRYSPGFHLPIYPDSVLLEKQPDYALLLAWNFAPEIIAKNPQYKGKWIIPLPTIEIRE